jgi:hypothetical protein
MSTIQILFSLYFALIGAYLSVVLSRVLRQNGRVLDKMDEGFRETGTKTDEGFRRMDETFKLISRLIVEENESTRKDILEALKS